LISGGTGDILGSHAVEIGRHCSGLGKEIECNFGVSLGEEADRYFWKPVKIGTDVLLQRDQR